MPRIAVIGNCQAEGLATCLGSLLPDVKIDTFFAGELRSRAQIEAALDSIRGADFAFSNYRAPNNGVSLGKSAVAAVVGSLLPFPRVTFSGFQPDMLVSYRPGGERLRTPVGGNHSLLIVACYLGRLTASRTTDLFNAYMYGVLGYFRDYEESLSYLSRSGARTGLDLVSHVPEWLEHGEFMHTYNHPHIRVSWTIARLLCDKTGLTTSPDAIMPEDVYGENVVWPVYPEIARRIGIPGSLTFKGRNNRTTDLDKYVRTCFKLYRKIDPEHLKSPEVLKAVQTIETHVR